MQSSKRSDIDIVLISIEPVEETQPLLKCTNDLKKLDEEQLDKISTLVRGLILNQ